jgi:drug/metabolite transporter (DMT)-like permease
MKNYRGILFMLIASFAFAAMGVFVKRLGKDFDTVEIVLFRNLIGVIFLLISVVQRPLVQTGGKPFLLLFRGFIGTLGLYAFAYNMVYMPLGKAFTFYQTSALFIAIFSYFFLKEKLNTYTWIGLIVGFTGILIIFRPDIQLFSFENLMGLTNGLLSAAAYIAVSELKKYYDTRAIVLSFMLWGVFLPLLSMLIGYFYYNPTFSVVLSQAKIPEWRHSFDIIMVGVCALVGQIYVTRAYGAEKAGVVSAISYSNVVFSVLLGFFIGDKLPDPLFIVGMLLIISSGLLISLTK